MNSNLPKFHFNNEYTDYTTELGRMFPDKYSHAPEVGDTVNREISFLGLNIKGLVVSKRLPDPKILRAIRKKVQNNEKLNPLEKEFLEKEFGSMHPGDFSDATRFVALRFSVGVSSNFVKKHLGGLMDCSEGREFLSEGRLAKIFGTEQDGYSLSGVLEAYCSGYDVISTKAIDAYKKKHAKSVNVENVAWSDQVLSKRLLTELNVSLDDICRKEPADYHPGSGKVVRDIVHPSLYCYVKGVSECNGVPGDPQAQTPEIELERGWNERDFWGRKYEDSVYQWLPAEFHVSEYGEVKIQSYINNLDREKFPGMYAILERMFEGVLPLFEAVCGSLRNDFYGLDDGSRGQWPIPLRNRTLQVVTKIVEYRVNEEENFDGVWHVEGMSHEEVLATALCVVKRDRNFSGAEIEFRRFLFEDEADKLISSTPQNANRPTDTMGGGDVRPLGRLKTPSGRVIVFPNSHIHRLSNMCSSDGKDAVRRIVVFWLVNPDRPIVSTANVPLQQNNMSLDEALNNRLKLMAERKLHKESYEEREVFLCEH